MQRLLTYDESLRPTANEALQDPWLTERKHLDVSMAHSVLQNLKHKKCNGKFKNEVFKYIAKNLMSP